MHRCRFSLLRVLKNLGETHNPKSYRSLTDPHHPKSYRSLTDPHHHSRFFHPYSSIFILSVHHTHLLQKDNASPGPGRNLPWPCHAVPREGERAQGHQALSSLALGETSIHARRDELLREGLPVRAGSATNLCGPASDQKRKATAAAPPLHLLKKSQGKDVAIGAIGAIGATAALYYARKASP